MDQGQRLLIFCPSSRGGIADYAHAQAGAIAKRGVAVTMLCPMDFCHAPEGYAQDRRLSATLERRGPRWSNRVHFVRKILRDAKILDRTLSTGGPMRVLFASYAEYLAPLWAWRFRKQRRRRVVFGAIAHDPVRDYQVGPGWWHRWSVASAYSFLREAFVHQAITLDTVRPFPELRTTVVPHGLFPFPEPSVAKDQTRDRLGVPMAAHVFLSFGHIRDNKNLPLVLEALAATPDAWLLVAGPEAKAGQQSSASLREMAVALGVAERVRWEVGYLEPEVVSNLFHASDAALLTYSSSFRSASGVLNVAGWFRKPVLVSGGDGNLSSSVESHRLGLTVSPDCAASIATGMKALMESGLCPGWDDYIAANDWDVNARLVIDRLFE